MRTELMKAAVVVTGIFVGAGAACASEPKPRPATIDPSNPAAAEGARLEVAALNPATPPAPTPPAATQQEQAPAAPVPAAEHGHDHGGTKPAPKKAPAEETEKPKKPSATVYTCPMDPDVTSDKPGKCPKCGMKLVPKEPAEGKK
jgi:hypothetical protein